MSIQQQEKQATANNPLQSEGGYFLEDLSELEKVEAQFADLAIGSELTSVTELGTEKVRDGLIRRVGIVTRAGYTYSGIVGIPDDQQTDVAVIGTSAWWTSDRGHNEHTGRHVLRQGSPFLFLGAEGSYRHDELVVPRQRITLARSAAAVLRFTGEIGSEYKYLIHEHDRHAIGESRGAMVGMGLVSPLDKVFAQNVATADLTAPCFPRRANLGDLKELALQLYGEARVVKSLLGKLAMNVFAHYPSTIDLHPYAFAHQLGIGPALLSGEAGEMAKLIEPHKLVHITTFNGDLMSMHSDWKEIFKHNDNVRITPLDGAHMTIADPQTLAYIRARIKSIQEAPELSASLVFDKAHDYVEDVLADVLKHKFSQVAA